MAPSTKVYSRINDEENQEESFAYAIQLATGSVLPMTLAAVSELGVFEILANAGPDAMLSAMEIAAKVSTNNKDSPPMLDRILRFLATHRVLTCSLAGGDERLYGLAPVSKYFVHNEDGVSLASFVTLMQHSVYQDALCKLKDALVEGGIPFEKAHGKSLYEYAGSDSSFNEVFNTAMVGPSTIVIKHILESYRGFENVKQLVDVAGGLGVNLRAIVAKHTHIKGINFDLPHVVQHAPSYPGVEHVAGDIFESVPKGDAIFIKWILHNWSDEQCVKLLKNCYNAIPDDGKVIAVDVIVPDIPQNTVSARSSTQFDVLMMTVCTRGKERTRDEFMALAIGAGFRGIRFECFVCNYWVMEFFK